MTLELELGGRTVRVTSVAKVLWPASGTTKADMLDYYLRVAPVLLPHIEGRPLTLGRYPDGVDGRNWFQTTCPHPPEWIRTYPLRSKSGRITRNYCIVDEPAALAWVVNLGAIELHPLLSSASDLDHPMAVAFDLDPGADASLVDCCRVAVELRGVLGEAGLVGVAKTSGFTGIHVYVPLGAGHRYAQTKAFAREVARRLAAEHPDRIVDRAELEARSGKVFIDWSQNDANKSLVAPYSLRAMPWPAASTPISWDEVASVAESRSPESLLFDASAVLGRVTELGDLFAEVLRLPQTLPSA